MPSNNLPKNDLSDSNGHHHTIHSHAVLQRNKDTDIAQSTLKGSPKLFGKFGTFVLCIGLLMMYFVVQLIGIYIFTPIVLGDNSLSISDVFNIGSFNGTVVAYTMILTLLVVVGLIGLIVSLKLQSKTAKDFTLGDYLALNPFSLRLLVGFVGLWLLFMIGSETLTYLLDKNPTAFMDGLYASANPKWLLIAVVVCAVPIYEEFMFRGVIWSALREQMNGQAGVWLATVVTSLLFALLHTQYEMYEMTTIFVLALLLGYARYQSGSLLLPILIHVLNNGVAMWFYVNMVGSS